MAAHPPSSGPTNRLGQEPSPYLRQYAHNPVDWFPWGEEALARAKAEGKPILLSVGYSACHWCHVMAHESFESPETARLMNDGIININQVPSQYLALGGALLDQVPNPFYNLPPVVINGVTFPQGKSTSSPTIQRRELLRPFPQFNNILMRQATLGESQYHAYIL